MSKKSLLLVSIQFSSFAFFGLSGGLFAKGIPLLIQVVGLALGLWGIVAMKIGNFNVQPEVKQTAVFVTKGPYKIIRNPMYSGLILFFGVSVAYNFSLLRLGVFLTLITVLLLKIFMEEDFLAQKFDKNYASYKEKTFRLIPYIF